MCGKGLLYHYYHHGIIKNKLRNSLKVLQIDSLLRVKLLCDDYQSFDYNTAAELHEQMQDGFISKLASEVDQLQFSKLDEETDDEAVIDFDAQESDSEASLSEYALSASDLEKSPHEREMEVSDGEADQPDDEADQPDEFGASLGFE